MVATSNGEDEVKMLLALRDRYKTVVQDYLKENYRYPSDYERGAIQIYLSVLELLKLYEGKVLKRKMF